MAYYANDGKNVDFHFTYRGEVKANIAGDTSTISMSVGKGYVLNQSLFWSIPYMQLTGYNGTPIIQTASYNAGNGVLTVTISHGRQVRQAALYAWTLDNPEEWIE